MIVKQRLALYADLMRLDRPIGILLLLWPTLWGLWFAAQGVPPLSILAIFLLGTVLMRSAGCVINDYADRGFDPFVERTKRRPLARRAVAPGEALALAAALAAAAFALIAPLNRLVWLLALVALMLAITYPFSKRFLALPQAYLGIAFGFGVPMAFAAVNGSVPPLAWILLAASLAWTIAYDTEYAMVDRDDDLKIGIRSAAITFGRFDVAAVMAAYAIALSLLAAVGAWQRMGPAYYAGLAVAAGLAIYHYSLIHTRSRERCFRAFLHNNWVGASVFAGIALDFALR